MQLPCAWEFIPDSWWWGRWGAGAARTVGVGRHPNLAARLQGLAAPNTLVISAATLPLLGGFFVCQALGPSLLKASPNRWRSIRSCMKVRPAAAWKRLGARADPLVGREQEVGLLLERWPRSRTASGRGCC